MRLTGEGTDPPSCWRGLSCCSPGFCFRGISRVDPAAACPGFSLCPFLTPLLLTWREPHGDRGDQRAPLTGYPAPLKSLACY